MRTKKTKWYDQENDRVLYGVKVYANGVWANLAVDSVAFLVETEQACEEMRKSLRRKQINVKEVCIKLD